MKDEVLQKALDTDDTVIPRYDIVLPDGTRFENAQLILKNPIITPGTPLNKQNLLMDNTAAMFKLNPETATVDMVLKAIYHELFRLEALMPATVEEVSE